MDVGFIDYWANRGDSYLHRASVATKMGTVALVIGAVVLASDPYVLLTIYLAVVGLMLWARLPVVKLVLLAAYPALFAILFAVSRWDGTWQTPAVIILKAVTAALAVVMLIATTPYPSLFAALGSFLPQVIADGLFMTYRSLFILLELMDRLLTGLRLRGGLVPHRYWRNSVNVASALGLLLIRAMDLSQRQYDVMALRGYRGRIVALGGEWRLRWADGFAWANGLPLGCGLLLLAASWLLSTAEFATGRAYLLGAVASAVAVLATLLWVQGWRRGRDRARQLR